MIASASLAQRQLVVTPIPRRSLWGQTQSGGQPLFIARSTRWPRAGRSSRPESSRKAGELGAPHVALVASPVISARKVAAHRRALRFRQRLKLNVAGTSEAFRPAADGNWLSRAKRVVGCPVGMLRERRRRLMARCAILPGGSSGRYRSSSRSRSTALRRALPATAPLPVPSDKNGPRFLPVSVESGGLPREANGAAVRRGVAQRSPIHCSSRRGSGGGSKLSRAAASPMLASCK